MEIIPVEIGKRIRDARKEKGMSQSEFADAAHISISQLSNYENGKKTPGLQTLANICNVLSIGVDSLIQGSEISESANSSKTQGEIIAVSFANFFKYDCVYTSNLNVGTSARYLVLDSYDCILFDLYDFLVDFRNNRSTYQNPESFYKDKMHSIARRIDKYFGS